MFKKYLSLMLIPIALSSLNTIGVKNTFLGEAHPNKSYVPPSQIPDSLSDEYYTLKAGFIQLGKKWRSGLIEHRKVAKVYPNTTNFYSDETIVVNSSFYDTTGLSTITLSENYGFSTTETITTSLNITLAGETTLAVGASIYGVTLSNDRSAQASISFGVSISYSSTYSELNGVSVTYNLAEIPNVPQGASIASCIVADYFECTASIKEEEYWFWGTYTTHDWQDFTVRFFTFKYNTYYFSNGQRGVSSLRPY